MTHLKLTTLAVIVFGLAACGNTSGTYPVVKSVWSSLSAPKGPAAPAPTIAAIKAGLTPQVLAQIEGPVMIAQIPSRNATAVLTLAQSNQGVATFISSDGITISLRDGIVVATRGLGFDLMNAQVGGTVAALRTGSPNARRSYDTINGENHRVRHVFECDYLVTGPKSRSETCRSADIQFENSYILDRNMKTRASAQWISAEIGYISIELLGG